MHVSREQSRVDHVVVQTHHDRRSPEFLNVPDNVAYPFGLHHGGIVRQVRAGCQIGGPAHLEKCVRNPSDKSWRLYPIRCAGNLCAPNCPPGFSDTFLLPDYVPFVNAYRRGAPCLQPPRRPETAACGVFRHPLERGGGS